MTKFMIEYEPIAEAQLKALRDNPSKRLVFKAVYKCLTYMGANIKHPSLRTHKYSAMTGPRGEDIFESYAQNNTPGAYRVFWYYGKDKRAVIIVIAITPHP